MYDRDLTKPQPAKAFHLSESNPVLFKEANGDDAKSIPVEMIARSPGAVDHSYWGRVYHDLEGVRLHKQRIPLDYVHGEEIGYANHFAVTPEGLKVSGALVPTRSASDPLLAVIDRGRGGVPYEASINFSGSPIRIEEVAAGSEARVNGQVVSGPCTIFREWPLRGVAVCPYGADKMTASKFDDSEATVAVELAEAAPQRDPLVDFTAFDAATAAAEAPSEPETPADAEAAEETPETAEASDAAAAEADDAETPAADETAGDEPDSDSDPTPAAEADQAVDAAGDTDSGGAAALAAGDPRTELAAWLKILGPTSATAFAEGVDFAEATRRRIAELTEENAELRSRLDAVKFAGEADPPPFSEPIPEAGVEGKLGDPKVFCKKRGS